MGSATYALSRATWSNCKSLSIGQKCRHLSGTNLILRPGLCIRSSFSAPCPTARLLSQTYDAGYQRLFYSGYSSLRGQHFHTAATTHNTPVSGEPHAVPQADEPPTSPPTSTVLDEALPEELVAALDQYIIGQTDAKRSLAIALRDRWRRQQLRDPDLRAETTPNNLLLMGPSGCGKTELARRIAHFTQAPFVKEVATKYTEVGFVGDDTHSMVNDLAEQAYADEKRRHRIEAAKEGRRCAENHIADVLCKSSNYQDVDRETLLKEIQSGRLNAVTVELDADMLTVTGDRPANPIQQLFDSIGGVAVPGRPNGMGVGIPAIAAMPVGVTWTKAGPPPDPTALLKQLGFPATLGEQNEDTSHAKPRRTISIEEALPLLEEHFCSHMIDEDVVINAARQAAENRGIIFIDEFDKLVETKEGSEFRSKRRGVQKELLSLMDGTYVNTTRLGRISTEFILFVASGSFLSSKPSDVMPELQGRLPIRSELKPLDAHDFLRILTETKHNLLKQQIALLEVEQIALSFTPAAIERIALIAYELNTVSANIGARRLKTVISKVLEDIKFYVQRYKGQQVVVDETLVDERLKVLREGADLTKYII